ncbi:MAG: ABC transporter ATP-binding protein [Pseudomonadota bacterium]
MSLGFSNVSHHYNGVSALHNIDISVETGELVCVLGPSGSGKSTLLKLAAGIEDLQQGEITLPELAVSASHCPPPEKRPTGLVLQEHALFPHLTVEQNLAFGITGMPASERDHRVQEVLSLTGLDTLETRYPSTLSGGQQQRVALARALAPKPPVMLMDEPFASVDVSLRSRLRTETRQLLKDTGTTALVVTHDPADATAMADRIAVIVDGHLVQFETPETLWQSPAHPFVAEVFAGCQLLDVTPTDDGVMSSFGLMAHAVLETGTPVKPCRVAIDPHNVELTPNPDSPVTIIDIHWAGRHHDVLLRSGDDHLVVHLTEAVISTQQLTTGQNVQVRFVGVKPVVYNCE